MEKGRALPLFNLEVPGSFLELQNRSEEFAFVKTQIARLQPQIFVSGRSTVRLQICISKKLATLLQVVN